MPLAAGQCLAALRLLDEIEDGAAEAIPIVPKYCAPDVRLDRQSFLDEISDFRRGRIGVEQQAVLTVPDEVGRKAGTARDRHRVLHHSLQEGDRAIVETRGGEKNVKACIDCVVRCRRGGKIAKV